MIFFGQVKVQVHGVTTLRLRVSKRQDLCPNVLSVLVYPTIGRTYDGYLEEIDQISKKCSGLRRLGAAS